MEKRKILCFGKGSAHYDKDRFKWYDRIAKIIESTPCENKPGFYRAKFLVMAPWGRVVDFICCEVRFSKKRY